MATVTLTLYTGCRIKQEQNFIVDNIETYLGTLASATVSNFQYQRFDLKKTINLDLDQAWQTKKDNLPFNGSTVAKKWNYCKFTTVINSTNVYYYYFITGYKQVSPKTVELSLEMDTINTFSLSDTYANNTYTLTPKTVVKREHKNRFDATPHYTDSPLVRRTIGGNTVYWFDPKIGKLYTPQLQWIIDNQTLETQVHYPIGIGTGTNEGKYTFKVYNSSFTLLYNYSCHNNISITPYDDSVDFEVQLLNGTTELIETFPDYHVIIEFTKISPYPSAKAAVIGLFNYCYMRGDPEVYMKRIVDPYNEGLSTVLFKDQEETLFDDDGEKHWMMAYRNDENTATTVNILLYPEEPCTVTTQSSSVVTVTPEQIPNKVNQEEWLKFLGGNGDYEAGNYIEVNGTQYEVVSRSTTPTGNQVHDVYLRKQNSNDTVFKNVYTVIYPSGGNPSATSVATNVSSVKVHGWGNARLYTSYYTNQPFSGGYWQDFWIGSKSSIASGSIDSWKDVKLYDTKLIKAFMFPYCPSGYFHGRTNVSAIPGMYKYGTTEKAFILNSANDNDFSYELEFNTINPQKVLTPEALDLDIGKQKARNVFYESKLFHSDYYQPKFVYDSFSYTFNLEDVNINQWIEAYGDPKYFSVTYTVSSNIISKFAFQFLQYATKRSSQDYEGVLCIERNNEKALFNSDYLNYIKNGGYSYDTKKANSQNAINGITTALSIVGATASFISTPYTGGAGVAAGVGLAVSATTGIARGIYTAQEQDKAISQKMLQAQMQGNTVEGNEDLDILTAICGNKAKVVIYELSNIMKNALWDLFHYCGYATHEQKVPTHNSRLYFNFVQAEIDYKEYNFNDDIAKNIKDKWAAGVTYLHKVDNTWDFDQNYENFEVSLMS